MAEIIAVIFGIALIAAVIGRLLGTFIVRRELRVRLEAVQEVSSESGSTGFRLIATLPKGRQGWSLLRSPSAESDDAWVVLKEVVPNKFGKAKLSVNVPAGQSVRFVVARLARDIAQPQKFASLPHDSSNPLSVTG